jgi:glycine/D-amino acid oxidase-like deaminating enzyme
MRRRHFLQHTAALAAAACLPAVGRSRDALRVGVIGGGIVGASIAYHLAHAGARVTLFEKAQPASGATRNSFAWLNAFVEHPAYRALRLDSLAAYHQLDRRLRLGIVWGGYTSWARTPEELEVLNEAAAQMASTPYPVRSIGRAQLIGMTPGLMAGEVAAAFYSRIDGHLDPVGVTEAFLAAARASGAMTRLQTEVLGIDFARGALGGVHTSAGAVPLDRLVIAAGTGTPALLAMAGFGALKLKHAPGILAHSRPTSIATRLIYDAPGTLSFKQMADGSIVGTDSPAPPDLPVHREIRDHVVAFATQELADKHGNRILTKIGTVLPAARGVALERLTLGFRPVPTDELPVIGLVPGMSDVHVAVMHSGVTLAPIVGRYVTQEVLHGARVPALAPFRPERFSAA